MITYFCLTIEVKWKCALGMNEWQLEWQEILFLKLWACPLLCGCVDHNEKCCMEMWKETFLLKMVAFSHIFVSTSDAKHESMRDESDTFLDITLQMFVYENDRFIEVLWVCGCKSCLVLTLADNGGLACHSETCCDTCTTQFVSVSQRYVSPLTKCLLNTKWIKCELSHTKYKL